MDMSQTNWHPIETDALSLVALPPSALRALIENDIEAAARLCGLDFRDSWVESRDALEMRLADLEADSEFQPWSLRAIARKNDRRVIGHIGCHAKPGGEYSAFLRPMGLEFGYTIFAPYRRRGLAYEAARALMHWALGQGVSHFILSIGPANAPSLALAHKLGFRKVGSHIDDKDGPEDILELRPGK